MVQESTETTGPWPNFGCKTWPALVATVLAITIKPLSPALGAEIGEVDLSGPVSEAAFREIRQAFLDNLVLVFRNQNVPPRAQVAFTERFGAVKPHPLRSRRGGSPWRICAGEPPGEAEREK